MEATPRPWEAKEYEADGWRIQSVNLSTPERAYNICYIARRDSPAQPAEANAKHIVLCVNAHDALLAAAKALEAAHSAAVPLDRLGRGGDHRWKVLRAAIAQAEGRA